MRAVVATNGVVAKQPTLKSVYVAELQGWRGFAIILLMFGHFGPTATHSMGRLGVEFFFVLSGRLMAQLLFIEQMGLAQFYVRRFSRVFPALWLFAASALVASPILGHPRIEPRDFFHAVTFTINYTEAPRSMAHLWSLCVEEHSYVILSVVAIVSRQLGLRPIALLSALALACMANGAVQTWLLGYEYHDVYWRTDTRAASIFVSAAIFLSVQSGIVSFGGLTALAVAALGIFLNVSEDVPDPIKYSLGTICLAIGVASVTKYPEIVARAFRNKGVLAFGLWSFSIYLWQQPFAHQELDRALYVAVALACGLLSFYFFENPIRGFINSRFS